MNRNIMEAERKAIIEEIKSERFDLCLQEAAAKHGYKCAKLSEEKRIKGNKLYQKNKHDAATHFKIWKLYSKSIRLAPNNSEELATAYGNRSALLVHLQKYTESIEDIDRALSITNIDSLKVKLLCRKIECQVALGLPNVNETLSTAKVVLSEIKNDDKDKILRQQMIEKAESLITKKKQLNAVNKITSEETEILPLSVPNNVTPCVTIQYNEKYQRHLVATRDIKPGEVILIEKPYAYCVSMKNAHAFCGNCLKLSFASIPCESCQWCMFCSEKCKTAACEKYHRYECPITAHIKLFTSLENIYQVSIRTLLMGIEEAGSIKKLKAEIRAVENCADKRTKGFTDKKLLSHRFRSIYSLSDDASSQILPHHIEKSLFILILLARYTTLLGTDFQLNETRECLLKNKDAIFIGSLLFKLIKINCNSCANIRNINDPCKFSKSNLECMRKRCCANGSYISALYSFINHSCFPNSSSVITDDYKVVVFAMRPIKKNSQVFGNYTGSNFDTSLQNRQEFLKLRFNFTCDCIACEDQWPDLKTLWSKTMAQSDIAVNPIEYELATKSQKLLNVSPTAREQWDEETLNKLACDVEKAMKYLRQPSAVTTTVISMLCTVFCKLYGMKRYSIPGQCNNLQQQL